jgi:hypothetical protein
VALLAAQFVVTGVGDGAQQPCTKGSPTIRVEGTEGGDEGFLRGIGSQVFVTQDAQGRVVDNVLESQYERVEGIQIPVLGIPDESGFVHWDYFTPQREIKLQTNPASLRIPMLIVQNSQKSVYDV